jgi:thiol peroxidase
MTSLKQWLTILGGTLLVTACATMGSMPEIDKGSAQPGGSVMRNGQPINIIGNPMAVGRPLPAVGLVEAGSMQTVDLSQEKGKVLFLSIVPSVDTRVCEAQTHYLGEQGDQLPESVQRITISRDTPFAQLRFAKEAKLTDIQYLSDYKEGNFGRATGLLMDEMRLLARSVVVVDQSGIVRYIQVVPDITHLPDMEKAFAVATELAK